MPGNVPDASVNQQVKSPSLQNVFSRGERQPINKSASILSRVPDGGGALEESQVGEWEGGEGSRRRLMFNRVVRK